MVDARRAVFTVMFAQYRGLTPVDTGRTFLAVLWLAGFSWIIIACQGWGMGGGGDFPKRQKPWHCVPGEVSDREIGYEDNAGKQPS